MCNAGLSRLLTSVATLCIGVAFAAGGCGGVEQQTPETTAPAGGEAQVPPSSQPDDEPPAVDAGGSADAAPGGDTTTSDAAESAPPAPATSAKNGLPVMVWSGAVKGRAVNVRAGVYLPEERRVLHLGEPISGAALALADPEQGVVVTASTEERGVAALGAKQQASFVVTVRAAPLAGESGPGVAASFDDPERVQIAPSAGGFHVRVLNESMGFIKNMRWSRHEAGSADAEPAPGYSPDGYSLLVNPPMLLPPGFGFSDGRQIRTGEFVVRGNSIRPPTGGPIKLSRGHGVHPHDTVFPVSPPRVVFVVSASGASSRSGRRHIVDRVDLESREVTLVSRGAGFATGRVGPDGAFYLQVGEKTRRFDPPTQALADAEPLPDGVGLIVPQYIRSRGTRATPQRSNPVSSA